MNKKQQAGAFRVPKLFYRRQEAAFALGLSVRSIDSMISDQRLTTRRFGRCILIPAADVERAAETILKHDMLQGTAHSAPAKRPAPRRQAEADAQSITSESFWTAGQVAERLHCSLDAVRKWLSAGAIVKTKAGGRTLIKETDLQNFLAASTKQSSTLHKGSRETEI